MTNTEVDFAAERRQLRRPDGSTITLPPQLQDRLETCVQLLRNASEGEHSSSLALSLILDEIVSATSADVHIKKISQLSPHLQALSSSNASTAMAAIARYFVFSWLLDCRVRYAHKALIGIARTFFFSNVHDSPFNLLIEELFTLDIIRASKEMIVACRTAPTLNAETLSSHRDAFVHLMNCMDSITVTLVPVYRSVFERCFAATLPLLGESVNWALNSALVNAASTAPTTTSTNNNNKRSRSPDREEGREDTAPSGGSNATTVVLARVFGEDVDLLRFFVRVTATHVHKFMQLPHCVAPLFDESSSSTIESQDGLTGVLCGAARMLSTPMLPKDVLNAAGLLVASTLTLRSLNIAVIRSACEAACAHRVNPLSEGGSVTAYNWWRQHSRAALLSLVSTATTTTTGVAVHDGGAAHLFTEDLAALFSQFSNIGRFAFFKGLLSHCQAPIQGSMETLPMLLLSDDNEHQQHASSINIVHDVIAANAVSYTTEVQEPDVRFMAIQTLDHVVRHIAGVLKCIAAEATRVAAAGSTLNDSLKRSFTQVCCASPKLRTTVQATVGMIMALWDDPTQQVSGPLYDTYRIVLSINEGIAACRTALGVAVASNDETDAHLVLSPVEALQQVLATQNDRRGKYHALLALVDVLPLEALLSHGTSAMSADADDSSKMREASRIREFCAPLIAGSCNSKISSVCGEVLAAIAKKSIDTWNAEDATTTAFDASRHKDLVEFWRVAFMLPIVEAAAGGAASFRGLNVSSTQAVSNVIAHMMVPLLKRWPTLSLDVALQCVVERASQTSSSSSSEGGSNWTQVAIEALFRARTCFIDTCAVVQPSNTTIYPLVSEALQSYDYELRMTAFGIAALSLRGAEPVTPWQCVLVERFILLNLHQGGDSTARGAFLQNIGKWIRRLSDSITSSKTRTGIPADPKKQKQMRKAGAQAPTAEQAQAIEAGFQVYVHTVYDHVTRLVALFAAHSGATTVTTADGASDNTQSLSLERRFAALTAYATLLDTLLPIFSLDGQESTSASPSSFHIAAAMKVHPVVAGNDAAITTALLPLSMVEPLLVTVSEGWDKIRLVAESLLEQFVHHNPQAVQYHLAAEISLVTSPQFANILFPVSSTTEDNGSSSAKLKRVVKQLQSARFKDCEGVVRKILLAARLTKVPRETIASHLSHLTASMMARCTELKHMGTMDVYRAIQARPLHGPLSLCAALFTQVLQSGSQNEGAGASSNNGGRRVQRAAPSDSGASRDPLVVERTFAALQVCSEILTVCSKLVSSIGGADEDETSSGTDQGRIDCRGHVYHVAAVAGEESDSNAAALIADTEALSRVVVNNSWLGIRAATSFVEHIVLTAPTQALPRDEISDTVSTLIDTLLRTKHNGVMSKCRQTLKSICSALLRSKQSTYYSIPANALAMLLGESGVTSSDEARVLRRSQGLPHAILPLLESEDPTVPFALFPMTMTCLFSAMSQDPSATSGLAVAHRVNALNVLKFIFDDKILGGRVVPYIQDAFVGAASGFRHVHWAVRNSSLMLFSSVLHRFIGDHPSTGGGGANTSFHDVASRIPRGIAFVLEALESAVIETEKTNFVQPALFPVLLMLSMLTPDAPHVTTHVAGSSGTRTAESETARDDNAHAMQLVQRCRSIRNLMARGASAGALCGLVPVEKLSNTIHELGQEMKRASLGGEGRNALHGALLHIHRLFGHYVGTIHIDAPIRPSSRFHPTLALSVIAATLRALSFAREELVVAAKCPTVADVYLRITCDVLYYSSIHGIVVQTGEQESSVELMCLRNTLSCALTVSRHLCESSQLTHSNADVVASKCRVGLFIALVGSHGRPVAADDIAEEHVQVILRTEAQRISNLATISNRWNALLWIGEALATRCGVNVIGVTPNRYHRDLFSTEQAAKTIAWLDTLLLTPRTTPYQHAPLHPEKFKHTIAASNTVATGPLSALLISTASAILGAHNSQESVSAVRKWSIAAFENITTILQFALTFRVWDTSILSHTASSGPHSLSMSTSELSAFGALLYHILETVPYSNAKSLSVQCLARLQSVTSIAAVASASQSFVNVVRSCASSEMPAVARHSAVTAVEQFLHSSPTLTATPSTVALLATHFRLLFDDEEAIRRHACEATTRIAARFQGQTTTTSVGAPRAYCQVSCAYVLHSLLRGLLQQSNHDATLVKLVHSVLLENCDVEPQQQTIAASEGNQTQPTGADVTVTDDVEVDEDDDEEVLFEREAANMFEEELAMQQWYSLIASTTTTSTTSAKLFFETLAQVNATAFFAL
ncbi:Hypothetical protein, putative [Bodo saltans]|uniref:Uncharacterized protein n=1 Tax=Bodo saltans TaxID=75058 RepID=A0A0S4JK18_BODSA|nr:Hypothetical protein, putative [Bodo saltans]|eukprot:CUG89549.1 Hypothetical protein, putative [Bodo saltans]